ncbi:MAG: type III secretion system chaperone, partial [Desulfovibrio sp.]|nr:type III secretion system chaperone [Desulfovibrio sp.]
VFFDQDEVIIEQHDGQLYLIAVLGVAQGREDAYGRLLAANYLGQESGQAVLGLDLERNEFVLHRILDAEMEYPEFEKILTIFIQVLRYWKEWLAQPVARQVALDSPRFAKEDLLV